MSRDAKKIDEALSDMETHNPCCYSEYVSDTNVILDGNYTLDELKQIIAIIEAVPLNDPAQAALPL